MSAENAILKIVSIMPVIILTRNCPFYIGSTFICNNMQQEPCKNIRVNF